MKRLKLFFACLLMAVLSIGQVWADDTPTEFSWAGSATDASGTTDYVVTESPITLTFSKGTNNNAPRTNKEGAVRMYTGTTLTISSSAGNITRVVFTPTTNSYQATNLTYNSTALTGNDWTLSSPAASVTLTATANARFKSMVVYTSDGGGGSDPVAVTGVSLDETAISLAVGETQTLTATVAPNNATVKTVSWSSSDESVATVDGGVVTAVAEGTATITVASTEDATKKATCAVTVTAAPAASNWQVIAPENLATGDVVVLTMNVGGTYYAAANNNGTSNPPSATSVAVTGSNLSATPATTLQWTVTVVSEGVFQFSVGDNKLYCTDTNNGVRVGDPTSGTFCNTFDIATENSKFYLHATTLTRYLGIYNSQDWRCYGSVNNNIKGGSLVIFKENDNREAAGLDFATKQYLIKKNAEFTAPTLVNPSSLPVTYLSSNTDVAEVAANGAITIKADATGAATITASFGGDETYKDGSASYTIFVAEKAGTNEEGEILTEAIAKELIDLGCTLPVYVTGTIQTPQYYDQSKTYTVTLTDGFQFYYFYAGPNETTFDEDILTAGDVLVAYGNLKKSGNNYRLNPCYMVSREPYSEPKVDISNTEATAYTPAQAIALYNDVTSDLTKTVYVKGVVTNAYIVSDQTGDNEVYNGTYNVYVKAENDDSETPTTFEFFRMYADDNNTTFEDGDIQDGDLIVAKGLLSKYKTTYEFAAGCQMVSKKSKATMTFDNLELVIGDEETLAPKTITLAQASAILYTIKEGSDDCVTLDGAKITATAEGSATIVATLATTNDYIGTSVEFSVTVTAAPVVLTDYYEKVTSGTVTEGTYLIVYEDASVAFNGGLETLDAKENTIDVEITNDHKIGVTTATEAATFYIDPAAGTIQAAMGDYIGVTSYGNGLKQNADAATYSAHSFSIDDNGNAVISLNNGWDGDMTLKFNSASNDMRFRYYKSGQQAIQLYKLANETIKPAAGLAWDPAGDIELTVGDAFSAPALQNPNNIDAAEITIASDNTDLATVSAGVVSLVADATGTATITATFNGNDDYKPATVSYNITVNEAGLDNVTFDSSEDHAESGETTITKSGFTLSFTSGSMDGTQAEYRLYKSQTMTLSSTDYLIKKIEFTCTSGNPITGFADATGLDKDNNEWTGESNTVELTASNAQVRMTKIKVFYVEDTRAAAGLAWNPAEDITLTVGDELTAPALLNPNSIDAAEITIESSNTDLATVSEGVVSLVADATGTTTITATFAGNDDFKPATVSYKITVNPAHSIYVSPSLNVNFGNVDKDAEVADKTITVTLTGVDAATLTLAGDGASAFTISPAAALTASGDITISASSANLGTFAATLTISDDASQAESKVVHLSLTVNEVVVPETPVSTTSEWVAATAIEDGMQVLITGVKDDVVYAMGAQANNGTGNNRLAVAGALEEGVFTPGANTMAFTLVAQGDGTYAIRTSNGKYLYAASQNANQLKTQDEVNENAKWTMTIASAEAEGSSNRHIMRFNSSSVLFSCYSTGQQPIALYVPKPVTPTTYSVNIATGIEHGTVAADPTSAEEGATITLTITPADGYELSTLSVTGDVSGDEVTVTSNQFSMPAEGVTVSATFSLIPTPTPDYTRGVTVGNYGTICLPNGGNISGAKLFDLEYYDGASTLYLLEVNGNAMVAGKPYIFLPSVATIEVFYTDEENAPVGTYRGLIGSYSKQLITPNEENYILLNNQYWYVNSEAYVGDHRAYIDMSFVADEPMQQQAGAPRRRVAMAVNGENAAQGFENIESGDAPMKVMIDGTLYILRGEKVYDATGRLVK